MATLSSISAGNHSLFITKPSTKNPKFSFSPTLTSIKFTAKSRKHSPSRNSRLSTRKRRNWVIGSVTEDKEVVSVKEKQSEEDEEKITAGESNDFEVASSSEKEKEGRDGKMDDNYRLISRAVNATIVLGAGSVAVTRLLTIDHDYWHVSNSNFLACL